MALAEKLRGKLLEFRFPALLLAAVAALVLALHGLGPNFLSVVSFFRPLLVSTALFLAAVLVLRVISPGPSGDPCDRAGEELMDYVAGRGPVEGSAEVEGASGEDAVHEAEAAAAAAARAQRGEEATAAGAAAGEDKKSQ